MRLSESYYAQDALILAPDLLGKHLYRRFDDDSVDKFVITETEAYRGEEDLACHASKGRTPRTEVMYAEGGKIYAYLIYGMYWLLNIVSGPSNFPQAVLIRGLDEIKGPGKVGKLLQLDKSFYGENLCLSSRMWLENGGAPDSIISKPRIGIDYAPDQWRLKPWRFVVSI